MRRYWHFFCVSLYGYRARISDVILGWLDNWLCMALLASAGWALSCVIDVCFVGDGIYRRPSDGPAIAGFFCLVPALLASASLDWSDVTLPVAVVGALSGVVFLLHMHFYFKALFTLNDAVNAEIFNTLTVLVVPVLAFLVLGERLGVLDYLAILIAGAAVVLLIGLQASRVSRVAIGYLAGSVTAASVLMVMQAWVLESANYETAVWLFSLAAFVTSLLIFGVPGASRRRLTRLCRRFSGLFIVVQLFELGAVLGSQRATDLGPSVSLVALLECSLPLFILTFSFLLASVVRRWRLIASRSLQSALAEQVTAAPSKIASMLLILVAIALVQTEP